MFQCTSFLSHCFLLFNASSDSTSCSDQCAQYGARLVGEQLVKYREKLFDYNGTSNWTTATDIVYDHPSKTFLDGISYEPIDIKHWRNVEIKSSDKRSNYTTDNQPLINDVLVLPKSRLSVTRVMDVQSYLEPFSSQLKYADGSEIHGQFWCTTPQGHYFPHFGQGGAWGLEPSETYLTARKWCVDFKQTLRTPSTLIEYAIARQRLHKTFDGFFWTGYKRINATHYQNEKGVFYKTYEPDPVRVIFSDFQFSIQTKQNKPGQRLKMNNVDCMCYRRLMPIDQAFKNSTVIACTVLATLATLAIITALLIVRNRSKLFQLVRSVSSSTSPSDDGSTSVESAYGSSVRSTQ